MCEVRREGICRWADEFLNGGIFFRIIICYRAGNSNYQQNLQFTDALE